MAILVSETESIDQINALTDRVARAVAITAKAYECPFLDPGYEMQFRELESAILREVRASVGGSFRNRRILDLGCGAGGGIRLLIQWGAEPESIVGVDAIEERIEEARRKLPPGVNLVLANAVDLKFAENSFDLVTMGQSMSMITDEEMRSQVAREAVRVLKPGGAIIWSDYRYQRPSLRGLQRPVTKPELKRMFAGCEIRVRSVLPFPPVSRRLARIWKPLWHLLSVIPPLRTWYVGSIIKRH